MREWTRIAGGIFLACVLAIAPAWQAMADSIIADGRTQTTIATSGGQTDILTATVVSGYGVNSFSAFGVGVGETVNIHAPGNSAGTVNILGGGRSQISGLVQGMAGGSVGGELILVNPDGFAVTAEGEIIAGSVGMATPAQGFLEGAIDAEMVSALAAGTAPEGAGDIDIAGRVAAGEFVRLTAGGDISISGELAAGERAAVIDAAVNTGNITVRSGGNLTLAPGARVNAGSATSGGVIDMRSGGDIRLEWDAVVGAEGLGDGTGGTVILFAGEAAFLDAGAVVSAAALGAGDGGFVEFSGVDLVELGGELRAWSMMGSGGDVLIDPLVIEVTTDVNTGGANYVLLADERITVASGVTVSTRDIGAGNDPFRDQSQGNSGNLTLEAPRIEVLSGAALLAFADNGFTGGDILLDAHVDDAVDLWTAPLPTGRAEISVTGAIVWGNDVTFRTRVVKDNLLATPGAVSDYVNGIFGGTGIGVIDNFISAQLSDADAAVASLLNNLDAANLPAAVIAEAYTTVEDSYIIASGDARFTSRAETQIVLDPDSQALPVAIALSDTVAITTVDDNQIYTGGDLQVRAIAREDLVLSAGGADSSSDTNLALAISARSSEATALLDGSTYWLPDYDFIPDLFPVTTAATGEVTVSSLVEKDITINARSGGNSDGKGQAVILSYDDTVSDAFVGTTVRTNDASLTIEANTVYEQYELNALVDDEPLDDPDNSNTAGIDIYGGIIEGFRTGLGELVGGASILGGAALVVDNVDTVTTAAFESGAFSARTDPDNDVAGADTFLNISAKTDLGASVLTANVGTPGGDGLSAGGSAIFSDQSRVTEALFDFATIRALPGLDISAELVGSYEAGQETSGGQDLTLAYGRINTDWMTRAEINGLFSQVSAIDLEAREAVTLVNRQTATTFANNAGGSIGLSRTDYGSSVLAIISGSAITTDIGGTAAVAALSESVIGTIAMRNGNITGDLGQGAASTAILVSSGEVRAEIGGFSDVYAGALTVAATDRTARQVVANSSVDDGSLQVLGAMAYEEYRRDTIAMVEGSSLYGLADGFTLSALSETNSSLVSIGRATGGGPASLALLGAYLLDQRDVIAAYTTDFALIEVEGDTAVSATREDNYLLMQATEASGGSAAGLAAGILLLGGETRAEMSIAIAPLPEDPGAYGEYPGAESEFGGAYFAGDLEITARNAARAIDISLGGGSADNFGGAGSLAYLDMGQLADSVAISGVTENLLDAGSERATHGGETDAIRAGFASAMLAAGDFTGGGIAPENARASETVARLDISGREADLAGQIDVLADDARRAVAVSGQLQAGVVNAATGAFDTYFSIDQIAENGVSFSLRPDSVSDAVSTAQEVVYYGGLGVSALNDFSDAISDGGAFSANATTLGAAAAVVLIGGSVVAEIDLSADPDSGYGFPPAPGGILAGGAVNVATTITAKGTAIGFGVQIGSNSIGASVSHARANQLAMARIIDGNIVAPEVAVAAVNSGRMTTIGGVVLAATGQAAVGGSLTLVDMDTATIAQMTGTQIDAGIAGVDLAAADSSSALSLALAGGGSAGTVSAFGAVSAVSQRALVHAGFIDSTVISQGDVGATATRTGLTNSVAVQGGIGGTLALGVAISDVVLRGVTEAVVEGGSLTTTGASADILVSAVAEQSAGAVAAGANVGMTAGGSGTFSLITREDVTRALVAGGDLDAGDSVLVEARSSMTLGAVGGGDEGMLAAIGAASLNLSGGGTVGLGVSVTVLRSQGTVSASVEAGSSVTAVGGGDGVSSVRRNAGDDYASLATHVYNGVAVVADNDTALNILSMSASAGGTAAIAAQVPVVIVRDDVLARISDSTIASEADIDVRAGNRSALRVMSFGAQASGTVSGGAEVQVIRLARETRALVSDSILAAAGDIGVVAVSPDEIDTWSASLSISGTVSVAGVVQSILAETVTEVVISGGTTQADGNLELVAAAPRNLVQNAANVALTGVVGVGATVLYLVAADTVLAEIADGIGSGVAVLEVEGDVDIVARADIDLNSTVVGGSGGLVALNGAILVVKTEQVVRARLGDNARMTGFMANALNIQALHNITQDVTVGNVTGGGVAIGAAIAVVSGNNSVLAEIGDGAEVELAGSLLLQADAERDISVFSAGIGGGAFAFQGSAALLSFGALATSDETEETLAAIEADLEGNGALDFGGEDAGTSAALADAENVRQTVAGLRLAEIPDSVSVVIGDGAQVVATGNIDLLAEEGGQIDATSGAVGLGPLPLAGGLTRLSLTTQVTVDIGDSTWLEATGGNVDLRAASVVDMGSPIAVAGTLGAVSAAAAISETHAERRIAVDVGNSAYLGDGGVGTGMLSIAALESGATSAEATGVGVSAVAVGGVFSTARNDTQLSIAFAPGNGTLLEAGDIDIVATREGVVEATGTGVSGGVISGNAVDVAAYDSSSTTVDLGAVAMVAADNINVSALSRADVDARATGANIGALAGLGLTLARAERTAEVALLGGGLQLDTNTASFNVLDALDNGESGASTLTARSFSATGGGAVGIGGASTVLINAADVRFDMVLASLEIASDMDVLAGSNTVLDARSNGLNLGIIASGGNLVRAESRSDVMLDMVLAGSGSVGGDLSLAVEARDDAYATARSGQGGIYTGYAASSEFEIAGSTGLTLDAGNDLQVGGILAASTLREVDFSNISNSLRASVAGFGGTWIDNDIDTDSSLSIAGQASAEGFALSVLTDIVKSEDDYSGRIGSLGALDGTSLRSLTDVSVGAVLSVLDGAILEETGSSGPTDYDTVFNVTTLYDLDDSVKIDTGGGILVPNAVSRIDVDTREAAIRIGNAEIRTESGIDMTLATVADISTEAYVNVYGLAGSPHAEVASDYRGDQLLDIAAGAVVQSDKGSVRFNAGSGVSGGQVVNASAELRVWNATALPVGRTPEASSSVVQTNRIDIAGGAQVRAGNDVLLTAGEGAVDAYAYGLVSDLYREAGEAVANFFGSLVGADEVSLDTEVGETTVTATNTVDVNGEVEAGINYFQQLIADNSGIVSVTDGISAEWIANADVRGELEDSLSQLEADLALVGNDPILAARLEAEIARLSSILNDMGTETIDLLLISDAYAAPGDIEIEADSLVGVGTLIAHGDATIEIVNQGPAVIELVNALIPYRGGGLVMLNGLPLTAASAPADLNIQATSSADVAAQPVISVENLYSNPGGISGDIYITGAVENLRGLVSAFTADGDIMVLGGSIDAAEVDIQSGGDFFLSAAYDAAVTHPVGSAFATFAEIMASPNQGDSCFFSSCYVIQDLSDPAYAGQITDAGQVVAQGNVWIYANGFVNINGLIQSGVTDYEVVINDNIGSVLGDLPAYQTVAVLYSPGGNGTSPAEDPLFPAASGNVTLRYDQDAGVILVDPIVAKGGEIEIVGQIISTGNGQLVAANGYAQVSILNESDIPVVLSDISTGYGEGAQGRIRLVDLSRPMPTGLGFVTTEYVADVNGDVTRSTTISPIVTLVETDTPTYEIDTPWRLVFASGDIIERADGTFELDEDNPGRIFDELKVYRQIGFDDPLDVVSGIAVVDETLQSTSELDPVTYFDEFVINADDNDLMAVWDDFIGLGYFADLIRDNEYVFIDGDMFAAPNPSSENFSDWVDLGGGFYERLRTVYTPTSDYNLHVIAADKTISIGFEGHDTGRLEIESVGDVIFNGSVYNRSGPTIVTSSGGAIYQNNAFLPFEVNKLTLDAAADVGRMWVYSEPVTVVSGFGGLGTPLLGSAGGAGLPITGVNGIEPVLGNFRVDQDDSFGLLLTAGGTARVEEVTGNMELLEAWAQSDLVLAAANSILEHRFASTPVLAAAGNRLTLEANAGTIGLADAPITFDTDILRAKAGSDINLFTESDETLRVRQVISQTGDIALVSSVASIIDYDFSTRVDRRAEEGLLEALWDELGLRETDSAGNPETLRQGEVIDAYEAAMTASYFEYFNRLLQDDGTVAAYDPGFTVSYSAEERASLAGRGLTEAEIDALEVTATQRLHDAYPLWAGESYDPNFVWQANSDTVAALTEGLYWTDSQLGIGLRRSLILPVTDTEPVIEAPNFVGRDINLASGSDIGRNRQPYVIDPAAGLTEEALQELWNAARIDISVGDTIEIARRDDIDIEATGNLVAIGAGDVLIGSEIAIAVLTATAGGDLRIKSADALTRGTGGNLPHILVGQDIVLEAAGGGIGALGEALLLSQGQGGSLTARAEGDIRLVAATGDLRVSEIFSEGGVVITTLEGDILEASNTDGINILTDNLVLLASGSIGAGDSPLDVEMFGGNGSLSAVALAGDLDMRVVGDTTAGLVGAANGDVYLEISEGDLTLAGLTDPGLADLFGPEVQVEDGIETELGGLDLLIPEVTQGGFATPFPGPSAAPASGGSPALGAIPALISGGYLELTVEGSVIGRADTGLDIRAVEGAEVWLTGDFGSADNYILGNISDGLQGTDGATLSLRDLDRDDAVAVNAWLANIGELDLKRINLTAGESVVRLINTGGDLNLSAETWLRGGEVWLAAAGENSSGAGADIRLRGQPVIDATDVRLLGQNTIWLENDGGLTMASGDLGLVGSSIRTANGCVGCGRIVVAEGDLQILSENVVELAEVDVAQGSFNARVIGIGQIEIDSLVADSAYLATQLGDLVIGQANARILEADITGSVRTGRYEIGEAIVLDAAATLGGGVDLPVVISATQAESPEIDLFGMLGMYIELEAGLRYSVNSLTTGANGEGISLLVDGVGTDGGLTLGTVESAGADVFVLADSLLLANDLNSNGGDVSLIALQGGLVMDEYTRIDAGTGSITLYSQGDMVLSSLATYGSDSEINLIATGVLSSVAANATTVAAPIGTSRGTIYAGSIETSSPGGFWVDVASLDVLVENGDLHLISTINDVEISSLVNLGGGDIEYMALGNVTLADADLVSGDGASVPAGNISVASAYGSISGGIATLVGEEVSLLALGGSLGTGGAPLRLPASSVGTLRALAQGEIALDVAGDLNAEVILSETDVVNLRVGGALDVARIGGTGTITVAADSVRGEQVAEGDIFASTPDITGLTAPNLYRDLVAGPQAGLNIRDPEINQPSRRSLLLRQLRRALRLGLLVPAQLSAGAAGHPVVQLFWTPDGALPQDGPVAGES